MKTKLAFTVALTFISIFTGCSTKDDSAPITDDTPDPIIITPSIEIETFSFTTNGITTKGKIYLPDSYDTNANLPAIYLIDFMEQHFTVVTDEFEKVIAAVKQKTGLDALVVTLEQHLDIDASPEDFQDYYTIFKDMTSYVDNEYTNNTSRTFIARGSEAGIVIMSMFLEGSEDSVFDNFIATDSPASFNSEIIELIEIVLSHKIKETKNFIFHFLQVMILKVVIV